MSLLNFDLTTFAFLALAIFVIARVAFLLGSRARFQAGRGASVSPIRNARPNEADREPLLLHCPAQGGWQVGVWQDGQWLDHATRTVRLDPDHYMEAPPLDRQGRLVRPWGVSPLGEKARNFALWLVIFLLVLALITMFQNPGPPPPR